MSFRQFGGLNYAPKHNIVASNYNTSNNLLVTQNVGQPNSYINFLSDISGNIRVYGDFDLSGNLNVSGNAIIRGTINALSGITGATGSFTYLSVGDISANRLDVYDLSVNHLATIGTSTTNLSANFITTTGTINAGGIITAQGGITGATGSFTTGTFSGTVTATSFNATSDYRIKEYVIPLDDKFIVDSLLPVTYKNKLTEKQDMGLIAHEVQEIYPFLVNGVKDGEDFQSVNYIGLIALLIKEVKYLKQRVKVLEDKSSI